MNDFQGGGEWGIAGIDGRLLAAALLGALLALGGLAIARAAARLARRRGGGSRHGEAAERGLRDLAREVEDRLDRKLDRLEALVAEARVLEASRALGGDPGRRILREDPFGEVSQDDRERVLSLAAMGKRAEAIAEEVRLPRGEVDLILRLHRSAGRIGE